MMSAVCSVAEDSKGCPSPAGCLCAPPTGCCALLAKVQHAMWFFLVSTLTLVSLGLLSELGLEEEKEMKMT